MYVKPAQHVCEYELRAFREENAHCQPIQRRFKKRTDAP